MSKTERVLQAIDSGLDESLCLLETLVRIPSRRWDETAMLDAANFLAKTVVSLGGKAELIEWPESHPYVLAEFGSEQPERILAFNHYDVEIEPAPDLPWSHGGPFDPVQVDGSIYGRGVADDKASLVARLACVQAFLNAGVELPIGLTMILEGKQALHSPGLGSFYQAHRDRLIAKGAVWENSYISTQRRPVLRLGEKGLLYLRLTARPLSQNSSSQFAAILPSGPWRLVWALQSLRDKSGQGLLSDSAFSGTYAGGVDESSFQDLEPPARDLFERVVTTAGFPDLSVSPAMAIRTLPTMNIVSLESGNPSEDVQLAIPAEATATVEIRLLPGMRSADALRLIRAHLASHDFNDIEVNVLATSEPHRTDPTDPFVSDVAYAAALAYGTEPILEPSSMAVGNQGVCGEMPIVGVGVFRANSSKDGIDESVRIDDFRDGIRLFALLMLRLAEDS